jgi:hypothetical protein
MPIPVFNEQLHKYTTPAGKPLAGVTSILGEYFVLKSKGFAIQVVTGQHIALDVLNKAADYGSAVHKILEMALQHGPENLSYPAALNHAVGQITAFIQDYRPKIVMAEQPLYSEKKHFAGTMDILFTSHKIRGGKRLCLADAKTGGAGALTGPQTAAYEMLIREHTGEQGMIDRFKLHLPKTGLYNMVPLRNPNDARFFEAKLYVRNYLDLLSKG